jgi:hypothetical protein
LTAESAPQKKSISKLWVLVVLLIGGIVGAALSVFIPTEGPYRHFHIGPFNHQPILQFHIILTTIQVALLVALVIVYVRIYLGTRANFALGLIIVLLALLFNSLLTHPLLIGLVGPLGLAPGFLPPFTDIFTIVAYTVFLYLSLE